ncbi:MAG TPA: hypothetical protein VGB55_14600, partial [Tepidisphaeraceae bacterium]
MNHLIEAIEPRRMMAGVSVSASQTLVIEGTRGDDSISVHNSRGKVKVSITSGDETSSYRFKASQVKRLAVSGNRGNDTIHFSASTLRSAEISGGSGDDRIYAEGNTLLILGGEGNDRITTVNKTGRGVNTLIGHLGRDRL